MSETDRKPSKCPNCNTPVEREPLRCGVCGYRSELRREFLWIYLGGLTLAGFGFLNGTLGVMWQGASHDHWTLEVSGVYPLAPWPEGYHWLGYLIVGIGFTLGGLGITRRSRPAWWCVALFLVYRVAWIGLGLGFLWLFWVDLVISAFVGRVGVALYRAPERDAARLQQLAHDQALADAADD